MTRQSQLRLHIDYNSFIGNTYEKYRKLKLKGTLNSQKKKTYQFSLLEINLKNDLLNNSDYEMKHTSNDGYIEEKIQ